MTPEISSTNHSPLATAMREARARGVTDPALAAQVGIPGATLRRIIDGMRPVGWVARGLAEALNRDVEKLFP
jgi:DNA-binding IclR family transcriptional regulator